MSWWDIVGDVIGIGTDIVGAVGTADVAFSDREPTPAEIQMAEAISQAMGIAPDAMGQAERISEIADMLAQGESNPQFAQLVGEEDDRLRNDYIQSIDMFMQQDRRQNNRAFGTGSINPERQDEMRAGALMNAFEDSRSKARNNARVLLKAASEANNMALAGYTNTMGALTGAGVAAGPAMSAQVGAQLDQSSAQAGFYGNLPEIGTAVGNILSGQDDDEISNNPT